MTTELMTAERWYRRRYAHSLGLALDGHGAVAENDTIAWIRDVQRNALEAAAAAVCPQCKIGVPRDYEAHRGLVHLANGRNWTCLADGIWTLLAMNPAPAGQETDDGTE